MTLGNPRCESTLLNWLDELYAQAKAAARSPAVRALEMEVLENWRRKYERGKVSVEKFAAIKHEKFSRKPPTSLK